MKRMRLLVAILSCGHAVAFAAAPFMKETFNHDPGWKGHNNHAAPKQALVATQDFGYSTMNHAGKAVGEVGG